MALGERLLGTNAVGAGHLSFACGGIGVGMDLTRSHPNLDYDPTAEPAGPRDLR